MRKKDLLSEQKRIELLKQYEYEGYKVGFNRIAGIDEVGRGPIAGPVAAAAVVLPRDFFTIGIDDSKKLTARMRSELAVEIKARAEAWAVAFIYPPYLDQINILNATRKAMTLAVKQLTPLPDLLLIDALKLPGINIEQRAIVKGDLASISIACASIIAKVERDRVMESLDQLYPGYGFARHKGYATRQHIEALMQKGPSALHRKSFEPVKSMLTGGKYGIQPGLFE